MLDRPTIDPRILLGGLLTRIRALDAWALVAALLFYLLIFHGYAVWYVEAATVLLALAALVERRLLGQPVFWGLIAAVMAVRLQQYWYPVDNHKFLLLYLCLSMALACCFALPDDRRRTLQLAARAYLVLVMGLAVVQKLLAGDYLSGAFFEAVLLTDGRFDSFMQMLGNPLEALAANRDKFAALRESLTPPGEASVTLARAPGIGLAADLITWWTLLIEAAIAVAFALARKWADYVGHALLLIFILCVYWVAPVTGFAVTLAILGIAVLGERGGWLRVVYVAAIALVEIYALPWQVYLA